MVSGTGQPEARHDRDREQRLDTADDPDRHHEAPAAREQGEEHRSRPDPERNVRKAIHLSLANLRDEASNGNRASARRRTKPAEP